MTLRAYRPNEPTNGNEQDNWQDTLLDRPHNNRQQSLRVSYGSEPKSKIWVLTGIFAVAAILITGYFVMQGRSGGGAIPLVEADNSPYKTQPDQPGGAEIPFQDKLVFNRLDPNGKPVQAEKLLPPAEEPMQAQAVTRSVTTPPVASTTTTTTATTAPTPVASPVEKVAAAPVETKTVAAAPTPQAVPATPVTSTATNLKTGTVASAPVAAAPTVVAEEETPVVEAVKPSTYAKASVDKAPVATTTATPTAAGSVRIQLASIPDQANAQKALPQLSSKFASALGSTKLSLVKADIAGKGTYWRVQSQPMDKASADRVCNAVKAQGGVCITAK